MSKTDLNVVESPLIPNGKTKLETTFSVPQIVEEYKLFGIDVSKYFGDLKHISLYKCEKSGYRFFYPFNVSGDSPFYVHFQNFDWYYMKWKWEHEISMGYIKANDSVLEVGCGDGSFLKKVNETYGNKCTGLELNETVTFANQNVEVINSRVEVYASTGNVFDVVCSYQVLEHISSVYEFLQAKIALTKANGKLIICVPNNESFLRNEITCLNKPPHHMGRWNTESLKMVAKIFDLSIEKIHYEPLEPYHFESYLLSALYGYVGSFLGKNLNRLFKYTGLRYLLKKLLYRRRHRIIGHSILIVFKKN